MSAAGISVLLVDDHEVVRKGIRALLNTESGIEVVGEAANGLEAVTTALELEPDVVLMDLVMPVMDGVEAMRRIRERAPSIKVLVLTSFGSDAKLFPAVKAGAVGYLLKDATPAELVRAIRTCAAGETSLTPAIARRLLAELADEGHDKIPSDPLTARETELLRQLARGFSNERIADDLHITEATVRTHVSHILAKLNLSNRTQAALYALREGVASLDDVSHSKG